MCRDLFFFIATFEAILMRKKKTRFDIFLQDFEKQFW